MWTRIRKPVFWLLGIAAIISLPSFYQHFMWFISGQVQSIVVQQRWDLVALNIGGFLLFLLPLAYRKHVDWSSMGLYTAFIVSLFVEMYGVPLTIYLSSAYLATPSAGAQPEFLLQLSILGQELGMTLWMIVGAVITIIGMVITAWGWVTLYRTDSDLTTDGIYRYSRHPQYIGIFLIAFGWFVGWPTLLTTLILPILTYKYYQLTGEEEEEVMQELDDPSRYERYRETTPRFL